VVNELARIHPSIHNELEPAQFVGLKPAAAGGVGRNVYGDEWGKWRTEVLSAEDVRFGSHK
jgi:hypothetical protein